MSTRIRQAGPGDVARIVDLVNRAYEVEWEFRVRGPRTDPADVTQHMQSGAFLLAEEGDATVGCVYVTAQDGRGYFGMLSVEPARQGSGVGRRLVGAAEEYCRKAACEQLSIYVVDRREVLFPWYRSQGYTETGRQPFPAPERLTRPAEMVVMSKQLSPLAATGGVNHG